MSAGDAVVSLAEASAISRFDRVSQSADYAVRDLLADPDDPLALASYLWTYRQHNLTSINGRALVRWGENWARQIFVERKIGPRLDEEVASAALAVAALAETAALSKIRNEIRTGLAELLSTELSKGPIPFKRISYGAMFLLGALSIGADEDQRIGDAVSEVTHQFREATSGGRVYGVQYAALLARSTSSANVEEMGLRVQTALGGPKVAWEDQIYLLQSLWFLQSNKPPSKELLQLTEQCLIKSPAWGYLMNGMEDMPPAGDGNTVVPVSHIYRAALLDVLTRFQTNSDLREEIKFHERYQGRRGVGISAFGFYLLLLSAAWFFLLRFMIPRAVNGLRFWFMHDYGVMSRPTAVTFFFGAIAILYLAHVTVVMVPALYSVLVRLNIQSDQRAWNILWPRLWRVTKFWLVAGLCALVLGLAVEVLGPSVEHIINQNSR